ncbi:hypothetical protein [Kineococcus sp. SYSU DK001]|uniref:hypothetical protein n=1 Tax=Kineococcus sp. SYSU DK001 TaxID=3383122 RepID=UPI003D7CC516
MTTADRAQDDLRTAAAAVAAARPERFPRWVLPATVLPYVGGFAALAVATWTGGLAWIVAGITLLVAFFALLFTAVLRQRVRTRPHRSRAQWVTEFGILVVGVLLYVFGDRGVALLVVGAAFGVVLWRQVKAQGRA